MKRIERTMLYAFATFELCNNNNLKLVATKKKKRRLTILKVRIHMNEMNNMECECDCHLTTDSVNDERKGVYVTTHPLYAITHQADVVPAPHCSMLTGGESPTGRSCPHDSRIEGICVVENESMEYKISSRSLGLKVVKESIGY
jgi:hypothetical protein